MKKKIILLFFVGMFITLFSQTGNVGINTTSPTANLHSVGSLRLEHPTMGDGKILRVHQNGNIDWGQPYALRRIEGFTGSGVDISDELPHYTNAYITLPPGKWIVRTTFPIQQKNTSANLLTTSEFLQLDTYFTDAAGSSTISSDYLPESAEYTSGVLKGTATLDLVDGSVILNNTTNANKTYYYYVKKTSIPSTTAYKTTFRYAANFWGENNFYAFPIN